MSSTTSLLKKIEAEQSADFDINLQNKNVQLPGGTKWDDKKPGAGNSPKRKY